MKYFSLYISFFIMFILSMPIKAVELDDLYKIKLPVSDQSNDTRNKAYRLGLETVLMRISGEKSVIRHPDIKRVLKRPTKYLVRYQYERDLENTYLNIEFNAVGINTLLRQYSFPIWGRHRPLTLIWLAIEENVERTLLGEDDAVFRDVINIEAEKRGLPIIAPLLDFEDAVSIQVSDVWGRFERPILEASYRYQPDLVANLKFYQGQKDDENPLSASWIGTISIFNLDKPLSIELTAATKTSLAADAVNWIADQLGRLYAIEALEVKTDSNYLTLTFSNIHSMTAAIELERFLTELSSVNKARIYEVNQFGIQYKLSLMGEAIDVFNALALEERVKPVKAEFGQVLPVNNLYTWSGGH